MTTPAYRRHDISDKVWEKLEPHLPGKKAHGEALRELTGSLTLDLFLWLEVLWLFSMLKLHPKGSSLTSESFCLGSNPSRATSEKSPLRWSKPRE